MNTIISEQQNDERKTNGMLIFQQIVWFEMNSIPLSAMLKKYVSKIAMYIY